MLDLTAKAQELPEEERKAFSEEYGEKISSLARRYAKQSARAVLVEMNRPQGEQGSDDEAEE